MSIPLPSPSITPREYIDATLWMWPQGKIPPRMEDGQDWREWAESLQPVMAGSVDVPDPAGYETFVGWVEALLRANQGVL